MRKRLLLAIMFLAPFYLFAQTPSKKQNKKKMDTTAKRTAVPKPEKYDPNATQWPKKDSLKTIENRNDSLKRKSKSGRTKKRNGN
ncbi:hypothetical protein [Pedobacter endophyticus]|uniref:Uncharacterized protein n=1 Tax=Pedobacter endophyticus TaxID=2789740 RepID=A0A7S9PZ58_9SPHI|nr:hypothetical protein [Pedobacter endophyticus]QPH40173.1 hypothetical protein IZT61_02515 [Pedobacter endophyticus]